MIQSFKGRELKVGMEVELYRNLHKNNFSIRDSRSKLVLAHANNISIGDCKLIVSQSGRERVIREQKKNVHAFVRGTFMGVLNEKEIIEIKHSDVVGKREQFQNSKNVSNVTYNPYEHTQFVLDTGERVYSLDTVYAVDNKIYGEWT